MSDSEYNYGCRNCGDSFDEPRMKRSSKCLPCCHPDDQYPDEYQETCPECGSTRIWEL